MLRPERNDGTLLLSACLLAALVGACSPRTPNGATSRADSTPARRISRWIVVWTDSMEQQWLDTSSVVLTSDSLRDAWLRSILNPARQHTDAPPGTATSSTEYLVNCGLRKRRLLQIVLRNGAGKVLERDDLSSLPADDPATRWHSVEPETVTELEFTAICGATLHRPAK